VVGAPGGSRGRQPVAAASSFPYATSVAARRARLCYAARIPRLVMSSPSRDSAGVAETIDGPTEAELTHVDCAIIVVSYNSAQHVGRLLDSLPAAADGLRTRCVVVDNDSSDETAALVRARADVALVEAGENLGYAGAINLGRAEAGPCSSVLILNPDLVLEPVAIRRLHEALGEPEVGIAVPVLLNDDGSLYLTLRREPSPLRALGDALFGARLPRRPSWLSETIRDPRFYDRECNVDWAGGAVMLISSECDQAVGKWDDTRFFLYSEETDFAARARQRGYHVRYIPTARARHEDGGSGRSPMLGALVAVNRVRYYEKYHGRPATSLFRAAVVLHYFLRSCDSDERAALEALCRRSRWSELPGRAT
jgi:N-acetylglucosaminyl-diphospho-decaprenol L-rhamnosyltransferase